MTARNVRDFGAVGDRQVLDSPAVNRTIEAAAAGGGGTVIVPPGVYRCGTIRLASHVRLYLEPGSVLRASEAMADYVQVEGMAHGRALIAARDCRHVSIEGEGAIDGRGEAFMDWTRNSPGEATAPRCTEGSDEAPVLPKERPDRMVYFHGCRGVRVDGVRLWDSPSWCLTAVDCEDLTLTRLEIVGHPRIPNNDGIHLAYCRRAFISNCRIVAADDAIAMTAIVCGTNGVVGIGTGPDGQPLWCEDVVVSDCILDSRGAGVRIGFFNDIVRRVIVHDCRITAQRGILVSARNRGMVEQVSVHDCRVATRLFTGNWWGCGEPFQVSGLGAGGGHIRDVELAQLDCRSEHGAILYADDAFRIEDVRVRNCRLRLQNSRHAATLGGHFDLRPRSEEKSLPSGYFAHAIPGIYARNIAGLHLRECRVDFPPEPAPYFGRSVQMEGCSGARAEGCSEA